MISSIDKDSIKTPSLEAFSSPQQLEEQGEWANIRQVIVYFGKVLFQRENLPLVAAIGTVTVLNIVSSSWLIPLLLSKVTEHFPSSPTSIPINPLSGNASTFLISYVASKALSHVLSSCQGQLTGRLQVNTMKQLLQKGVDHFLQRSLDFHVHTSSTEMFNFINKIFMINQLATSLVLNIIPTLLESVFSFAYFSYQFSSPFTGGSLFFFIVLYSIYSTWISPKLADLKKEELIVANATFEKLGDVLCRYKLIRDCNQLDRSLKSVDGSLERFRSMILKSSQLSGNTNLGYRFISYAHLCFLLWHLRSKLTAPLIHQLEHSTSLLPTFLQEVYEILSNYEDLKFVFSKLSQHSEIIDPHPTVPLTIDRAPEITFKNVRFQYPQKEECLFSSLSFTVPAGRKVALVSRSGAGKTSIFNLLYRYYPLEEGTIEINGQDISKVSLDSLQKQICLLGQQPLLFNGTLRENILFGAPDPSTVSDEMLHQLANSVGFTGFFDELKSGLDTEVGEGGRALSGGQQQKAALLRSLLKNTKLRLLDEATASLDNVSAARMLDTLLDRKQDITTIMITHKLTEARKAEFILFLEEGKVIAQGTHEELLKNCSSYRELWEAQERGI